MRYWRCNELKKLLNLSPIKSKGDFVDIGDLYSSDKVFLLFKIRELSFGEILKVETTCKSCRANNFLNIDLSKLKINYVNEDFKDPKKIKLPDLNKYISLRLPRSSDSQYLLNKNKILENLWRFITKIGKYTDPKVISCAIEKMASVDIRFILENLLIDEFGLDTKAKYVCSTCRDEHIVEIPISESFFTVS